MCTNKHFVINPYGKKLLVKCGHCPACMQEKALSRTNKIINHMHDNDGRVCLFVTLTYKNICCPFIYRSELINSKTQTMVSDEHGFKQGDKVREIGIYRMSFLDHSGRLNDFYEDEAICLSRVHVYDEFSNNSLKKLRGQGNDNIVGVCYYKDVQDFIKRLRINISRDKNISYAFPISFYCCSEYGPTTCRPHFHLLIYVPKSFVNYAKVAIAKAWPYADYNRTYYNIKEAIKAASYVASYVNSDTSVPLLFRTSNYTRMHHSSSKGFGLSKESLSFSAIYDLYRKRDFRQDVLVSRNGVPTSDNILIPKYALYRYFRKFKGYSKINANKIESICARPSYLAAFAKELNYKDSDLHKYIVMLNNLKRRFCDDCNLPLSVNQKQVLFGEMYSQVWTIYSSNVLASFYNSVDNPLDYFEAYDNIKDFYSSKVRNESLEDLFLLLPTGRHSEEDPNKFKKNVSSTSVMNDAYHSYSKDRKVRNSVYSSIYGDS